jgi:hypothetical protein
MRIPALFWCLAAAAVGLASPPRAVAADDTTVNSTPPPTANYTDQPRNETYSTSTFHHSAPYYHSSSSSSSFLPGQQFSYTVRRPDIIFFPPSPPALGDAVAAPAPLLRNQPIPPPELGTYIHELFMPQLGSLLYHNDLPRKWRVQVEAYRASRDAAVEALRERIEATRLLERSARASALASFAREQEPILVQLEAEAERIRELLTNGNFFNEGSNWNDYRRWRLGDDTQWESNIDELRVLRAAVFYQRGLSVEQRDLLREMALELTTLLEDPLGEINLSGPGPTFAFSPSPARLRLPAEIPLNLAERLVQYREQKADLKRELRDEIYAQDRAWFASRRVQALRMLAEQQAPRFAALEAMADSLRREFEDLPGLTPRLSTTGLPQALLDRISRYLEAKTELQATLTKKLNELRAELPFDRIEFARVGSGYGIVHMASRQTRRTSRRATLDAELSAFNATQVARFEELTREKAAIQAEVNRIGDTLVAGSAGRSLDSLLRQFDENVRLQQRWVRYQDYQDATLLPDLSPAQRRLLFAAGMNRLAPPITFSRL